MSIRFEHSEPVRTTPERAFAVIDDLSQTSKWLPPCVSLEKLGSGPNAAGDALRYVYREGGRTKEMAGKIIARAVPDRLLCTYADKAFDVTIDLRVAKAPEGALTTHIIEISPKSLIGRLMSPLIRLGLKKQTRDAATNLRKMLESAPA